MDIALLDVQKVCSFTDYLVICSSESSRQMKAIFDEVAHILKREGIPPHHCEGAVDSGWLLLDFGSVIVHIFSALEREYYQLDDLWSRAIPIIRIQ